MRAGEARISFSNPRNLLAAKMLSFKALLEHVMMLPSDLLDYLYPSRLVVE